MNKNETWTVTKEGDEWVARHSDYPGIATPGQAPDIALAAGVSQLKLLKGARDEYRRRLREDSNGR